MLNRRKALIGATTLAAPAAATAAQSGDALIEKYAAAMYEAYYENNWDFKPSRLGWEHAHATDREFGLKFARSTLEKLGLLSPKGTV